MSKVSSPSLPTLTQRQKYLIIAAAVIVFLMVFCVRTVDAGQVGIITRFGEVNRTAASGITLKLPWPIESIHKMDIRVQKEQQVSRAATSDLQDVTAMLAVNYALDSNTAIRVYKEIGPEYKDRIIIPAVQESFKAASANYSAQELITKRSEVKAKAFEVIKARLAQYDIRVIDLNVVDFKFSQQFNQALEATQVARQEAEKARQNLERVKVEAQQEIEKAQGSAEAQRLQQQTITPELIELKKVEAQNKAIDKWNGQMPSTVGGDGTIFNIPVKQ
ncbi:prohibitin family protein [Candidatus Saccharibacteria bacterium]|nr:prohibitin family protein [Candidatus Saccharibacteria bacterium]